MSYFVGMKQFFQQFCNDVITLDPSIRFVGVADEHGLLLSTSERKDLKPLLNTEETQQYAITAATRQYTRIRWQTLLGKIDYTCSHYDKLLRATIPLTDKNNHLSYDCGFDSTRRRNNKIEQPGPYKISHV